MGLKAIVFVWIIGILAVTAPLVFGAIFEAIHGRPVTAIICGSIAAGSTLSMLFLTAAFLEMK